MEPVSVVIPTYNRAHKIGNAILSVLEQTQPPLEIIVVDDGSTDDTARVVAGFGPRVRYFHKPNGGASAARNFGIARAQGTWLAFLDSDDAWLPDKLQAQLKVLARHPLAAVVLCDCVFVDEAGREVGAYRRRAVLPRDGKIVADVLRDPILIPSTALVRKVAVEEAGGFDESLVTAEDMDLFIKIAERHEVYLLPEPLTRFQLSDDSLSDIDTSADDRVAVVRRHASRLRGTLGAGPVRAALCGAYLKAARAKTVRFAYGEALAYCGRALVNARTPGEAWAVCRRLGHLLLHGAKHLGRSRHAA